MKKVVHEADAAKVSDPNFEDIIKRAVTTFLAHAQEEEEQQFSLIQKALTAEQNDVRLLSSYRIFV